MGHRVPNHGSKCKHPHGHTYRLRVEVSGPIVQDPGVSDEGMVMDFSDLKVLMTEEVHDRFDHSFAVYEYDPLLPVLEKFFEDQGCIDTSVQYSSHSHTLLADEDRAKKLDKKHLISLDFIPTAENLAHEIFRIVDSGLKKTRTMNQCAVIEVALWETPTSVAIVRKATR